MYFRIDKNTPTGQKIAELYAQMQDCDERARELVTELGGQFVITNSHYVAGGIFGIRYAEKPEGWKKVYSHYQGDFFLPKYTPKNKALLSRIDALPKIKRDAINELVGFKRQVVGLTMYSSVGFLFGKELYLLSVADETDFLPNEDMIELTSSQYKALAEQIKPSEPIPA